MPRDGLQVLAFLVAQGVSQAVDDVRQAGVRDELPRPHATHQLVLPHQSARLLDEHDQRLNGLPLKVHGLVFAQQELLPRVETERAELVNKLCFTAHRLPGYFLEIYLRAVLGLYLRPSSIVRGAGESGL